MPALTLTFADDISTITAGTGRHALNVDVLPEPVRTQRLVTYLDPGFLSPRRPQARIAGLTTNLDAHRAALRPLVDITVHVTSASARYRLPTTTGTDGTLMDLYFASLEELVGYLRWSARHAATRAHPASMPGGAR